MKEYYVTITVGGVFSSESEEHVRDLFDWDEQSIISSPLFEVINREIDVWEKD